MINVEGEFVERAFWSIMKRKIAISSVFLVAGAFWLGGSFHPWQKDGAGGPPETGRACDEVEERKG